MNHLKIWFATLLLAATIGAQEPTKLAEPYRSRLLDRTEEERQDDAEGRAHWWRLRMGGELPQEFWVRLAQEGLKERTRINERLPGIFDAPAAAATSWVNIGPTTATRTQNGSIVLSKVDSGRVRWILPHPTDADILYVVVGHGGLWRASGFTSSTHTWTPLSDNLGSTSVGAAAFGKSPLTLYLGMGDPFGSGAGYGGTMGGWWVHASLCRWGY